jgi:hypothetical protein
MTFSIVETALSEMVDQSPGINLLPRETGDTENAAKLEKIWKYTWEKGNGDVQLMRFMKDALIYGTAIGEEYYRQDRTFRKEMQDFDLENFKPTKWNEKEGTDFDDCYFEAIPIWNFYVDPRATSLDTAADCLKRVVMSEDDFLFRYKKYPNSKKVKGGGPAIADAKWFDPIESLGDNEVECWHYYHHHKDLYLVIANGVLLTPHNNPNPYKHKKFPFVRGVDVMLPHSFYGMGEPRVTRDLEDELDTIRNMRLDTAHLNIHQMFLVDDRLELDDDDFIARPHGAIKGPPGSIVPIETRPIKPEAYKEEELLKDDIIRATGIDPRLQALGGKGDTATEVAILKEASLKRVRLKLRMLERISLSRIARLRIANIQQFYSLPKITQVIGEGGEIENRETYKSYGAFDNNGKYKVLEAKPKDVTGMYDIIVVPGSTLPISKSLESQKAINLFDRLKGHPDVNQRKLVEWVVHAHDKEPNEVLTQPGEPPMGTSPTAGAIPPTPGTKPGFNQQKLRAEDTMPQRAMGGTPNYNQ